jgi:type II secretory pathway pseudopilin PulG
MKPQNKALTLLEVVVALVLVATTASALLVAHGRSLEQAKRIEHLDRGESLARQLILQWRVEPVGDAPCQEGKFKDNPAWRWTRICKPATNREDSPLLEVCLTLHRLKLDGDEEELLSYTWIEKQEEEYR